MKGKMRRFQLVWDGIIIEVILASLMPFLIVESLALANPETVMNSQFDGSLGGRIPQEEWNRTFGGSSDDVGSYVQQTNDGGYITAGYTSSFGADAPYSWLIKVQSRGDIWLIKTDPDGKKEWDRTFGGLGKDLGFCVQQTKDGGFIITGAKKSFWVLTNYDVWLIKTDPEGKEEWERTFGGSGEGVGFSVQQTTDGGYIIAGYTTYPEGQKAWLIKTDPNGDKEWDVALGRKDTEAASIQQTTDGGYVLTGYTTSFGAGKEDVLLVKTDSRGAVEWAKNFGGSNKDLGLSVQKTKDGGYIITGYTESFGAGKGDVWLIKTNSTGIKEWDRTFGGPNSDLGSSVQEAKDGGYIITGYNTTSTGSPEGNSQLFKAAYVSRVWLIKTNSTGIKEWDRTFDGSGNAWGNCVQETQDGGYIITGVTESYGAGKEDVWLIKVK
jgi:hypothetical protein